MIKIKLLTKNIEIRFLDQIEQIFFESSSRKSFSSELERAEFLYDWFGLYLDEHEGCSFYAIDGKDKVLGYLVGCLDSQKFLEGKNLPSMAIFSDSFLDYPAHLHINCHPASRGRGVGVKLIQRFEECMVENHVYGWHIITISGEYNNKFYRKVGCDFEIEKDELGPSLLLQSKKLH